MGSDSRAMALGIKAGSSGARIEDEGVFLAQHARWAELMFGSVGEDVR